MRAYSFSKNSQNFVFAKNQIFFAVDLDIRAGVFSEQNAVACLHIRGDPLAVIQQLAVSDGNHLGLLRLLLSAVGNDDAASHALLFFQTANEDAVVQRTKVHKLSPVNNLM